MTMAKRGSSAGRRWWFSPLPAAAPRRAATAAHAQRFRDPDQQHAGQEEQRLVVGQAAGREHDVPLEQPPRVGGVPALEETPRRPGPEGLQPGLDEAADRGPHAPVVPEVLGGRQDGVP